MTQTPDTTSARQFAPLDASDDRAEHDWFPVGAGKFVALSLCTLGLYELYWSYKQWQRIQKRTGESLRPFWRAFFAPLWNFSLLEKIRDDAQKSSTPVGWSAPLSGTVYFAVSIAWRLPDPWWLISLGAFLPLMPVVGTISALNDRRRATESRNESFSAGNLAVLFLGGVFLLLTILGTLLPTDS
jgi:hypothetical protein